MTILNINNNNKNNNYNARITQIFLFFVANLKSALESTAFRFWYPQPSDMMKTDFVSIQFCSKNAIKIETKVEASKLPWSSENQQF